MLNFESIKGRKTIIGGLEGEYKALLTGFDIKPDSKGNPNYKFEFSLVEYPGKIRKVNTSLENMYEDIVSDLGLQFGFEPHVEHTDEEVLVRASKEVFSIWINGQYTNFRAPQVKQSEKAIDESVL